MRVVALQVSHAPPAISTTSANDTACHALTMIAKDSAVRVGYRFRLLEAHRRSRSMRVASAAADPKSRTVVATAADTDDRHEGPVKLRSIGDLPGMCIIR